MHLYFYIISNINKVLKAQKLMSFSIIIVSLNTICGQNCGKLGGKIMPRRGENIRKRSDNRWEGRYIKEYDIL